MEEVHKANEFEIFINNSNIYKGTVKSDDTKDARK
jgi:hypothetical protein